jgi:hypothetical protein
MAVERLGLAQGSASAASTAGVYYEVAAAGLDEQVSRRRALDGKVATVFVAASSILPIFAGLLALGPLPSAVPARLTILTLMLCAAAVYLALLYGLYRAYHVGARAAGPDDVAQLRDYWAAYTDDAMREWVADACLASITENAPGLEEKAVWLEWALRFLPLEALLLVAASCVTLVTRG